MLHDGTVLIMGGETSNGLSTASVERFAWEPRFSTSVDAGFWIATADQSAYGTDGIWSLEARVPVIPGGIAFGGLLPGAGQDVAYASFTLAQSQTVRGVINLETVPGAIGPLEFSLQVLDANRKLVGSSQQGLGAMQWSLDLSAGSYTIQIQMSSRAPAAAFQALVLADRMEGGALAGASLQRTAGVTGYLAFGVAAKSDVTFSLYNEQTLGSPRGAGEVVLRLLDPTRKIVKEAGPGVERLP